MATRVEVSKRVIAINSVSSLVQPVLSITVLLWLQQWLIHRISIDELAIYQVILSVMTLMPLVQMIVSGGIARFCTEAYAKGDDRRMTEIVSTMTPLCVGTALLVIVIGLPVAWFIDHILTIAPEHLLDARIQVGVSVLMSAVQISTLPFGVGFKVRQKYMWENVIGLGCDLMRYVLMFVLLFGVSPRALWVVLAGVPSGLIGVFLLRSISRRLVPALHFDRRMIRRDLIAPLMAFQAWNVLARTATLLRSAFTAPLFNKFGTSSEVVAFRYGSIVESRFFPIALSPLGNVQTVLVAFHATGQKERLRNHYFRYCRYVLWSFLFVAVPFVCYRAELWQAYLGSKYAEVWQAGIVAALLLAKGLFVFNQPVVAQVALAQARNKPLTIRTFVIEITTAVAIWVAIVRGGGPIAVAAVTLGVAAVLTPALHWTFGLQLTETRFSVWLRRSILPGVLPAAIAVPAGYLGHALLHPTGWFQVLPQVAAVEALYVLVIYAWAMDDGERSDVRKALAAVRTRFQGPKPAPAE